MGPRSVFCTIAFFLCLAGTAAGALSNLRLQTSATWAENVSRSSSALDWADAMTYVGGISADHRQQFNSSLTGMIQLQAGALFRPQYNRNDELNLGVTGELKQKFGLGPMAPVLSATGSITGKAARMNGNDGWTVTGALNASKRLTESWRLSATADWHNHYADSDTFNVRYQRIYGELFWDITDRWQLNYGYGRFWGDLTANASWTIWGRAIYGLLGPAISNYYNAMPWEVTDSYGPGWVTYRVYGKSRLWWLQVSPALTDKTSLSLRYDSVFTVNKVNVKYRTDKWTLSLLHNF
ncbi:MAG: hypothetical protein H7A44_12470 [Opitutaceae bacterium]|nr:hypothetical protein [Cephaloticoccus sp.]MCP5531239.1 hypothetical protein [Opitutaceae bacterium]